MVSEKAIFQPAEELFELFFFYDDNDSNNHCSFYFNLTHRSLYSKRFQRNIAQEANCKTESVCQYSLMK